MTFPFFWSALLELEAGWLAGEAEGALPVGVAGALLVEEEEGGRKGYLWNPVATPSEPIDTALCMLDTCSR